MKITKLVEYNVWANRLLTTQIESLSPDLFVKDFGGSFGSMKATMIHVLQSDWLWLKRWKGIPLADLPDWKTETAKDINGIWKEVQDDMLTVSKKFEATPDAPIEFVTRKGARHTLAFQEIVFQVSHHGSYHRGQLANMIRTSGEKPVSTDYFLFTTQRG